MWRAGKIRRLSGVCPQHDLVFEALTCVDNLALVGAQKGMSDAELSGGACEKLLDEVGLHNNNKLRPHLPDTGHPSLLLLL